MSTDTGVGGGDFLAEEDFLALGEDFFSAAKLMSKHENATYKSTYNFSRGNDDDDDDDDNYSVIE